MGTSWLFSSRKKIKNLFEEIQEDHRDQCVSFVEAESLIDESGAFVRIDSKEDAEKIFLPDVLVLYSSQVCESYETLVGKDLTQACFITGESKTADIEQVLVSGVHGPKECIFVRIQ